MAKKAISPIIAVIILIALAVTIGGLVSSWMNTFVTESTNQNTCGITTMYMISDASYNQSMSEIRVRLKNTGKTGIFNFSIEADNGTVIVDIPASSPATSYVLDPGKTQYIVANISGYNISNIDTVKILAGSCPGYSPSPVKVVNI